MSHKITSPEEIICPHCGAANPGKAYVCLTCYKLLRSNKQVPWWRIYIRTSWPVSVTIICLALIGVFMMKQWLESIEAQITMNVKSEEYNLSVVAGKKKKKSLFETQTSVDPVPSAE